MTAAKPRTERHWWSKLSPLTNAQRDMVASCAPMLFKFVNEAVVKHRLDYDTTYDEVLQGLIHGSLCFSPNRGVKWCTYAGACIKGRIRKAIYDAAKARNLRTYQFSIDLQEGDSFVETNIEAPDDRPLVDVFDTLAFLVPRLPKRLQTVIRCRLRGFSQPKIANRMRCSRQRVHQMQKEAIAKMREIALELGLECPC